MAEQNYHQKYHKYIPPELYKRAMGRGFSGCLDSSGCIKRVTGRGRGFRVPEFDVRKDSF